jgi:hypothetical protein
MRNIFIIVLLIFFMLIVHDSMFGVVGPVLTEENVYLAWMRKHSDMDNNTLLRAYNAVKLHPQKDRLIAMGIIESNFNPTAKSLSNARGIWQIIPKWWYVELKEAGIVYEVRDFWNIECNAKSVIYIIDKYTTEFGADRALVRYLGHNDRKANAKYARDVKKLEKNLRLYRERFIQ